MSKSRFCMSHVRPLVTERGREASCLIREKRCARSGIGHRQARSTESQHDAVRSRRNQMTTTLSTHHLSLPEGVEMPLTPDEIAAKSFPSVLRGYAKWEVDEFLKDVALDYQRALGLAEWAMQRSSAAPGDHETLLRPAPTLTNAVVDRAAGDPAETPADSHLGATVTTNAQPQIDRLGEHIRYLAILVHSMGERIDHLEGRLAAKPAVPFYPAPTMSASSTPSPAMPPPDGQNNGASTLPPAKDDPAKFGSGYASVVSAKDWWPTESPLSVLTRAPGTPPARNQYGPRA